MVPASGRTRDAAAAMNWSQLKNMVGGGARMAKDMEPELFIRVKWDPSEPELR